MFLTNMLGSYTFAQSLQIAMTGSSTGTALSLTTTNVVNQTCGGSANGQISVSMTGGTPTYTYSWYDNPLVTTATRTGLVAGTYTVEGSDAMGCKRTLNVTVGTANGVSTNPTAATASNTVICNGGNSTLTLVGGGGGAEAVIKWYSASCGGTLVGTGNGLVVYPTTTTTYYGRYEGLCNTTACANVTVTVTPIPTAPTLFFSSPSSSNSTFTVCSGTPVTIASNTANVHEYLWYKNGISIAYALAPNNTYTVSTNVLGTDVFTLAVTYNGGQCVSAMSAPLTLIKSMPTAVITPSGSVSTCANVPITLTANTGANYSYVWKRGTTIVQTGGSSYIPTVTGNHNVTVTDGNTGCKKTSAWTNVTIKTLPIANAGADLSVCVGESALIGSASVAGNTYTWTPSTGLSNPYIANPIASPSGLTTYTLTVNNGTTGCSNTDAMVYSRLLLPPTPSLTTSTTPVCQGTSISITPTSIGSSSLNWYKNGQLLYNKPTTYIETVSLPSAATDIYTVKGLGTNGCLSSYSNYKMVWVKAAAVPIITSSPVAVGNLIKVCVPNGTSGNATLTANTTTASPSYVWKLAGANISGATSSTYIANVTSTQNNKVFSVQATYPNGCVKISDSKTVTLVTSGCTPKVSSGKDGDLTEIIIETDYLSVYPNPTDGLLNVNIGNSAANEGKLLLYDALGQSVWQKNILLDNGKANERIDLSHLAVGVYSLIFQTENGEQLKKVVKE